MTTSLTGIITIAEGRIANPDEARIHSIVTGLLKHRGKRQRGKISVVSQSLGGTGRTVGEHGDSKRALLIAKEKVTINRD